MSGCAHDWDWRESGEAVCHRCPARLPAPTTAGVPHSPVGESFGVGGEAQEAATNEALRDAMILALGPGIPLTPEFKRIMLDRVWPLVADALGSLRRDNEALTAKLALPCGSCHPCDNWADETWRREGKKPPAVITWQDTLELKRELIADLDLAQSRLTAALTENQALKEYAARDLAENRRVLNEFTIRIDALDTERAEARAELSAAQSSLAAALQVIEDVRKLGIALANEGTVEWDQRESFDRWDARSDEQLRISERIGETLSRLLAITDPEGNTNG